MAASLLKSVECLLDSGYSVLGSALGEGESGGSAFDESAIVGQSVRDAAFAPWFPANRPDSRVASFRDLVEFLPPIGLRWLDSYAFHSVAAGRCLAWNIFPKL
jgi:hypothetical protein